MDNRLEDLQKRENPESSDFICYDRFYGPRSRVYRVYTDIKLLAIPKLIILWYPLLIIIMLFSLTDFP